MPPQDFIVFGGFAWTDPRSSVDKQMTRALAKRGHRVLFLPVYPELQDSGREVGFPGGGCVWPRSPVRTPLLPFAYPRWNLRLNMARNAARYREFGEELGLRQPIMLHYAWHSAGLVGRLGQSLDIVECIDAHEERPNFAGRPARQRYVLAREKELLLAADGLVVTSPLLLETRRAWNAHHRVLLNGIDPTGVADAPEPKALSAIPRPRIALAGTLGPKIDLELARRTMEAIDGAHLVLLGRLEQKIPAGLRESGRVHMLGSLPHAELMAHMAHCDLGLIPLTDTAYNRATCPLKTLEYAAAGIPVLSVPNPAVETYAQGVEHLVRVVPREGFPATARSLLDEGGDRGPLRALVERYTWSRRADALLEFIAGLG